MDELGLDESERYDSEEPLDELTGELDRSPKSVVMNSA